VATVSPSSTAASVAAKRWAYLERARTIRFATTNDDGSIYLTPLWLVVEDRHIYIPVDAGNRHAANAEAGRALVALVDGGDEYATVTGIRIRGELVAVDDAALTAHLGELVLEKYFHAGHPYAQPYLEFGEFAGRRFFELVPSKMMSWDMRERSIPAMPEARVLPGFVGDRLLDDG
jgi:hypothetical protein